MGFLWVGVDLMVSLLFWGLYVILGFISLLLTCFVFVTGGLLFILDALWIFDLVWF